MFKKTAILSVLLVFAITGMAIAHSDSEINIGSFEYNSETKFYNDWSVDDTDEIELSTDWASDGEQSLYVKDRYVETELGPAKLFSGNKYSVHFDLNITQAADISIGLKHPYPDNDGGIYVVIWKGYNDNLRFYLQKNGPNGFSETLGTTQVYNYDNIQHFNLTIDQTADTTYITGYNSTGEQYDIASISDTLITSQPVFHIEQEAFSNNRFYIDSIDIYNGGFIDSTTYTDTQTPTETVTVTPTSTATFTETATQTQTKTKTAWNPVNPHFNIQTILFVIGMLSIFWFIAYRLKQLMLSFVQVIAGIVLILVFINVIPFMWFWVICIVEFIAIAITVITLLNQ